MLSKFKVENFLSFYQKQEISFNHEYSSANIFKNNTLFEYKEDNRKKAVVNGAIILGANASGKTNLINAMNQMKKYYLDSVKFDKEEDISVNIRDFAFNKEISKPISFEIEFIKDIDSDYYKLNYNFSVNPLTRVIEDESLSYNKILKTTISNKHYIFKRNRDSIELHSPSIYKILNKIEQENIEHKLVLSLMNFDINRTFFRNEIDTEAFRITESCGKSIEEHLLFNEDSDEKFNPFIEEINSNKQFKEYILSNLYNFDFALADFDIEDITEDFLTVMKSHGMLGQLSEEARNELLLNVSKVKQYKIETIHKLDGQQYNLPIGAESAGTKKFLKHSLKIYESLLKGKMYISDEFDSHYHIHLQEGIINNFIYPENNKLSQFLIITHNPLLLNPKLFAKEQVYFIEKDRTTESSSVFSLKEFKEISYNNHNWTNLYLSGRIGAVPEVFG